jgi:RecA/RadA recombinase
MPTKAKAKAIGPKKEKKGEHKEGRLSAKELTDSFVHELAVSPTFRGKAQVVQASRYLSSYCLRRPTGIMGLDIALGGGWPAGGQSQVFGAKSVGKSHLVFRTAGEVQKNYGGDSIIFMGCSEMRFDKGFARRSGFCVAYAPKEIDEMDNIRIAQGHPPFTKEEREDLSLQIGQVVFSSGITGDYMLDTSLEALRKMRSRCQLLIIESFGSLLTPAQDKNDVGDQTYGGSSGMLTNWQNKVYPLFMLTQDDEQLETTILTINQVRAVIGGSPQGPKTRAAAGSKAIEHAQLINLELKNGEPLHSPDNKEVKDGCVVKWETKKGKAGTHDGIKGEYEFHYPPATVPAFWNEIVVRGTPYGIDAMTDLSDTALSLGVVTGGGAYLTFDDGMGPPLELRGSKDAPAKQQFAQAIVNDQTLEQRVRAACIKKAGLTVRFK